MNEYRRVFHFGWPYLRRYWRRLALGILLGIVFAASNASFVGLTNLIAQRLDPEAARKAAVKSLTEAPTAAPESEVKTRTTGWKERAFAQIDPWLPRHGREPDGRQLLGVMLIVPMLVGLRGLSGYFSAYCMGWVGERVVNDLRVDVVTRLSRLSLDYFNRSRMGDLITRVNGDTGALQRCLGTGFEDLIKEPVTVIAVLAGMFYVNPQLTLLAAVFLPVAAIPMRILGRKARRAGQGGRLATEQQANLVLEFLGGIRVVKAFGLETPHIERFRQHSNELVRHAMKGIQAREQINPIIEVLAATGFTVLVVLVFLTGGTAAGTLAFLVGALLIYQPIKKLGTIHVTFQQTSAAVERLTQLLTETPSVVEAPDARALGPFREALEFEHVSFAYDQKPVLRDVSVRIPSGIKLGVAGESGSGKSTFINLLFRFYDPTAGNIRFDGIDLRGVALASLRQQMALVSQEVVLFDQTVTENIAYGRLGATQAEVETAARAANADGFIQQLPQGYQTMVGERGVTLSGGQRQRLAIARAFVRNAPILVLDEATAALDSQSEAEVQAAIDQLAEQRTVICIAHRLSTLASMDRIIVFSQGRIVEEGGFQELLRQGGIFAGMAAKQGIRPQ
jgi:subfamily B ATP-binding cassette protein MsbA